MTNDDLKIIGNIGAGTMGHATALQFAMHGYPVHLLDQSDAALAAGMAAIEQDLATFADAGLLTDSIATIMSRITPTTDYAAALSDVDFIIESVAENLQVKQSVWRRVESIVGTAVTMATNTSGLSPTAIQSVLKRPERFVVAHFWNPAQLMPLVEVVPGEQTETATVNTTVALMRAIGKHPVALKKASLGFVGNRIQLAVLREALHIVAEGIASPAAVDEVVQTSLGRRWGLVGPIASADLGGLDIFDHISQYLYADLANETTGDATLAKKVAAGDLGLKSGQGFYDWSGTAGQDLVKHRDAELLALLQHDRSSD